MGIIDYLICTKVSTQNRKVECNHVNNYKYGLSRSNPIVTLTFAWTLATSQHACLKNKVGVFCLFLQWTCRHPEWVWTSPDPRNYNQDFAEAITHIISIRGTIGQNKQVHRASLLSPSMKLVNASLLFTLKKIMLFVGGQRLWEMQDGTHNVTSSSSK